MPAALKKRPIRRTPNTASVTGLQQMVESHDQVLFGYTDRETLKYVPGLVDTMSEISLVVKSVKTWGARGTVALILLQLGIIFHQYGVWPYLVRIIESTLGA